MDGCEAKKSIAVAMSVGFSYVEFVGILSPSRVPAAIPLLLLIVDKPNKVVEAKKKNSERANDVKIHFSITFRIKRERQRWQKSAEL